LTKFVYDFEHPLNSGITILQTCFVSRIHISEHRRVRDWIGWMCNIATRELKKDFAIDAGLKGPEKENPNQAQWFLLPSGMGNVMFTLNINP